MTGEQRDQLEHEAALKRCKEQGIEMPTKWHGYIDRRTIRANRGWGNLSGWILKMRKQEREQGLYGPNTGFRPRSLMRAPHLANMKEDRNVDLWILED